MPRNLLFFSDSSILNPILHSQGLPLLKFLSKQKFKCYLLSFESLKKIDENKVQYDVIRNQYISFISLNEIFLNENSSIPFLLNYFIIGFVKAKKIIKEKRIEIIHARSLFPAIISLLLKINYPNLKVLYDNRGVFIDEQIYLKQWKREGLIENIFRILERWIIKKSDHIVVVSRVFKDFLINEHPAINNLSEKISVINNKTYIDKLKPEDFIKQKNKNIICVFSGSSAKWQNLNEVITFAQNCLRRINNFRFKILTYEVDKFEKEILNYKELFHVTEILNLTSDKVFDQLTSANFGLLLRENNLINNVSSPLKFAEYLAAGLPIVVSEGVGDTEEIINSHKVGIVVKHNDFESAILKLEELLREPDIYTRCRYVAEKYFNIEDSFNLYNSIYCNI